MAYVPYSPAKLRELAESIELPAKILRDIASDMESQGVESIELQIKTISYRYIWPLTEWAEEFRFDAAKRIHKAAKRIAENAATDAAADAFLAAQQKTAKKPVPRKKGKK